MPLSVCMDNEDEGVGSVWVSDDDVVNVETT